MSKMIAFCGLCCTECPTFIATKNDDDAARAETAAMYAKNYGFNMKPEEINCDGCHSTTGRLISYCQTCDIRTCGQDRGVDTCASCNDQPCEKLTAFHSFSPEAKDSFEAVLNRAKKTV
jgi:Protein of unknown function (DUF3795)